MPHSQRLHPGYSVIELLIVLVIVSVMLGTAGVHFRDIVGTLRIGTVARVLATDLSLSASDRGAAIAVYPNGLSSAQLVITITDGTRSRSVTLSSGGAVRMVE